MDKITIKDIIEKKQKKKIVTICTYNKQEAFGAIENNKMTLNEYGSIAKNTWLDLPNHIHGILHVVVGAGPPCGDAPQPAQPFTRPARPFTKYKNSNNMSIIIGSYKSSVTRQINKLNHDKFRWQRSFHDYIIRTSKLG